MQNETLYIGRITKGKIDDKRKGKIPMTTTRRNPSYIYIYMYMYIYDRKGKNLDVCLGEEKKREKENNTYISIHRKNPYEHIYFRCGS